MNLFADYVHPLTDWLRDNPSWSLFITFIIALSESLAIIGSIVPGSVTMTAIGILAGSGIMRIDLTLLASTLGAICGDSLSYALGYFYSERLVEMWPFKKYPSWLSYGKDFFSRHGGKSVLIGRFVGPLRSIIPVIAGIMHMKQWRFLVANSISAIGWSLLYVLPGVFIGAASHELSAESATRLFIIILFLLFSIWLIGLFLKYIVLKLRSFFKNNLHNFWITLRQHPYLLKIYHCLTPKEELNHYATAGLILLTIFCSLGSIALIVLNVQGSYSSYLDLPVHLFLQSVHTHLLEVALIVCTQLTSKITLIFLYISCCLWLMYHQKLRTVFYLSFLIIISCCIGYLLSELIYYPRPQGLLITMSGSSFPNIDLLVATALYGFIFYYLNNKYSLLTSTLRSFILILLGLSGIGAIYLGDYWLTDILASYFIGAFLCLMACIFYRKENTLNQKQTQSIPILTLLLTTIILASSISTYFNFRYLVYAHTPYQKEYILSNNIWWNQHNPLLPLYRLNRVGRRTNLLNIQFSGDLSILQGNLEQYGWEVHEESFLAKVLMRVNNENEVKLPLLTQLFQNKRPDLVMAFKDINNNKLFQLMIWESNYNLQDSNTPLWIGTLHAYPLSPPTNNQNITKPVHVFSYIIPALHQFALRKVALPKEMIKTTTVPSEPYILLIKEHDNFK